MVEPAGRLSIYPNSPRIIRAFRRFQQFMFDVRPGDHPCFVAGMGISANIDSCIAADLFIKDTLERYPQANQESIKAAFKVELSPNQILEIFDRIVKKTGWWAGTVFSALPPALEAAGDHFSPEQIIHLFEGIVDTAGWAAGMAFLALPAALEAASKRSTPEQLLSFFDRIFEKTGGAAADAISALPAALGANLSQDQVLDLFGWIIERCAGAAGNALSALPAALEAAGRHFLYPESTLNIFDLITRKTGPRAYDAFNAFAALYNNLSFSDATGRDLALRTFYSMLDNLTDHNREKTLNVLSGNSDLYASIGPDKFPPHYRLYLDILIKRKRLGFPLLEGVLEAVKLGIIPEELSPEEVESIDRFIDRTHSFSPTLYKLYREKGEAILDELMPLAENVRRDRLGKNEVAQVIERYRQHDGLEMFFAVVQMAIPFSGASFVRRGEARDLFEKIVEAGDLRGHVPQALKGVSKRITLEGGDYVAKEGEVLDPNGKVRCIIGALRSPERTEPDELKAALGHYLRSGRDHAQGGKVRDILYRGASCQDRLGEKVNHLYGTDYQSLCLLEHLFRDKEGLIRILISSLEEVDPALLLKNKESLRNPKAMIRALRNVWASRASRVEKQRRAARIMAGFRPEDINEKILASGKLAPDMRQAIEQIWDRKNQMAASRHHIAREILKEPQRTVRLEKSRYGYMPSAEGKNLSLQMVKGIPYGMWELCAGICITSDIELWKDPAFKLIAMIDEKTGSAVGFVHVYEVEINGKRAWILPGIEPSIEFIGTVNPGDLYDKLMGVVAEFARSAGISAIFLPTTPGIHSNRTDIQKVIKAKKYRTRIIPQISWTRKSSHPFNEVFVVWER